MEIWKPIVGINDKYEVSNLGRVRSLGYKTPLIFKPRFYLRSEYLLVRLTVDGKRKYFSIHRLVAEAFIPNPDNKPCVNHINGIKTDNRVKNLEWVTRSENQYHALKNGLAPSGEKHPNAKFTKEQIIFIRDNPANLTGRELAKKFNVTPTVISGIQLGKCWKNAGGLIRKSKCPKVPEHVRNQIRAEYQPNVLGHGSYVLAKKFGVSEATILNIVKSLT